jgi:SecD/SecF fusion protein
LADTLKRRLDPYGQFGITIRPAGGNRIEILLPAKGRRPDAKALPPEEVKRIKHLIAQAGSIEFRILANSSDDKQAIDEAMTLLNRGTPEVSKALEEAQVAGLPPPEPRNGGLAGPAKDYEIRLPRGHKSCVTYRWVEVGPQERRQLSLDDDARDDPKRDAAWKEAARARGKATTLSAPGTSGWRLLQGALFYSRECKDRNLPEEERRKKQFEYFVLARNPEIDPTTGKETPRIDGTYLTSAYPVRVGGRSVVAFALNAAGGNLLGELTRKNVPSGAVAQEAQVRRHLAILLDGLVVSAPTVNSEIRQHGQINGNFTAQEVDRMVNILRAGTLPVRLRPRPVAEITVEPATK